MPNYNGATAEEFRTSGGELYMTEMRRMTISLPDELDKKILELKKDDRFIRCSYSEIVRQLLDDGFAMRAAERDGETA